MKNPHEQYPPGRWAAAYISELHKHLRGRLAGGEDAQDIAQEACLKLLQTKHSESIRNPKAYLYRIAHNLLYQHYNQAPARHSEFEVEQLRAADPSPEEQAIVDTRRAQIDRALAELPDKCRIVLLLRWRDGLRVAEIAARMQLSRAMVKKYLAAGLAHFRKRLNRFALADRA